MHQSLWACMREDGCIRGLSWLLLFSSYPTRLTALTINMHGPVLIAMVNVWPDCLSLFNH